MAKKNPVSNGGLLGMVLAGVAALVAGIIGFNELSKSKSSIKGNTAGGYNSVRPSNSLGNNYNSFTPSPKKGGCGCNGGA